MKEGASPGIAGSDQLFGGSSSNVLRRSLVLRFGCYLTLLVSLALAGMFSALLFADYSHQDAAVINQAGSLRMLTYRLGMEPSLEKRSEMRTTLAERLDGPEIRRLLERLEHEAPLREEHRQLRDELSRLDIRTSPDLQQLDVYVGHIDHFVGTLQHDAERRSQMLSTVQGLCLFLSLLVVFITLYDLSVHVVGPLRELTRTARRLGRGELDTRVVSNGEDELSLLGERFNQMAEELQGIYGDLEARVEEKTRALSHSHQRLELLYASARRLGEDPYDQRSLQPLLARLESVLQAGRVTLCLNKDGVERAYNSLTTTGSRAAFCLQGDCNACRAQAIPCDQPAKGSQPLFMQPLVIGEHRFGDLFVEARGERLQDWQQQFLAAFCDNIARTFALSLQQEQESRLALLTERGTIARELHDSLAQSLSYLKIQVSRLGMLRKRDAPAESIDATLNELREGLNSAYRQLRELLTTFRLSLEQPSLEAALAGTVKEFTERGVAVELDNRITHIPLHPNEEIHLLQIIREALSNVARHSGASNAWVRLNEQADGRVEVCVEDDGIGFDPAHGPSGHYGLSIMRERSQTFGAQLDIGPRAPQGTRVRLSFTPQPLSHGTREESIR